MAAPAFAWARANYVLSLEAGLFEDSCQAVYLARVAAELRRGRSGSRAKLTHAGAAFDLSAHNADEWLRLAPGTGGALALGLGHILLRDHASELAELTQASPGASEYRAFVAAFSPQRTAGITTLPVGAIERLDGRRIEGVYRRAKHLVLDLGLVALVLHFRMTGKILANAEVDGSTSRPWALYSSLGPTMQALRGKKLAFVKMGCKDTAFLENAMLESEVGLSFFSGQVGKPDLGGTVAEVVSRKGAEAVFAPSGSQKGLTKVFDTGSVPNPAFVQINDKLPADLVGKVKSAVVRYGGGGAISGWKDGDVGEYRSLRGRMGTRVKEGVFSSPDPVRVDAKDILIEPATLSESDLTQIKQHFQAPAERQE